MLRAVHFEIAADDLEKVALFYQQVFGWQLNWWQEGMPYIVCNTGGGPGISGAFTKRMIPNQTTINTIDVPDVDAFIARVEQAGGAVIAPKMEIPGVGLLAYCQDIEGNVFGILQPLPQLAATPA
jgi:predicted enzyme related to lactoylglutathione lyase